MYSSPILSALLFSDNRKLLGKFQHRPSQETCRNTDGRKKKKKKKRANFTLVLCVIKKCDEQNPHFS